MSKIPDLRTRILKVLEESAIELKISELAIKLRMNSSDLNVRKTLQRALKSLLEQSKVEARMAMLVREHTQYLQWF